MTTDVFVIDAPHQLLNAMEARDVFGGDAELIIIAAYYPLESFGLLIDGADWAAVHAIETKDDLGVTSPLWKWAQRRFPGGFRFAAEYRRRRRLDGLAKRYAGVKRIVLGNYTRMFLHFANLLPEATVVLLDDGTSTLMTNSSRVGGSDRDDSDRAGTALAVRAALRSGVLGLKVSEPPQVTFFTSYELEVRPGDSVIRNPYSRLRALAAESELVEVVYFLGQPLSEDRWMLESEYLRYLAGVKEHLAAATLYYVPHKREAMEKVERIRGELGLDVVRFDVPIEYALVRSPTRPKAIASFHSSALDNCRLLFGDLLEIFAFYIRSEHLLREHGSVERFYDYYRTAGADAIQVIDAIPDDGGARAV